MRTPDEKPLLDELSFQLTVTRAMLGTLELDQILHVILTGIAHRDGLGFNRAFLLLADEGGRELHASTAVGPADEAEAHQTLREMDERELALDPILRHFEASTFDHQTRRLAKRLAGLVVPLSAAAPAVSDGEQDVPVQALIAHCAQRKEPFYSNTTRAVYPPLDDSAGEPVQFHRVAVVPLMYRDQVLGVIMADNRYNRREIDENQMRGLTTLGNLAVIAIEKARLHRRLKKMTALDGLTGVFNRRHYEMRLEQEVALARRSGRCLALMVFDIDRFQSCNEKHGHEVGDRVLKDLAALLRERVRAEDMVARRGGAEFVVLLTGGATADEAYRVAEKLRTSVESGSLGARPAGEITVSSGVSHMSPEMLAGDILVRLADEALTEAKRKGRNRVVLASAPSSGRES